MTLQPIVTIGITTYDREDLLAETINSVVNQEYKNWKLIISNDNPNRFLSLANLQISEDPRIYVVNQPINLGEIANLNWLMNSAETEYFTWLADDDLMHPDFLNILLMEISHFPNVDVIFSNFEFGEKPNENFYETCNSPFVEIVEQIDFLLRYSSRNLHLIGVYGIYRLNSLRRLGGIPSLGIGFSPWSDNLLPILLSKNSKIVYTNTKLIFFRTHFGSISNSSADFNSYQTAENEFMQILKEVTLHIPSREKNSIHMGFIEWFLAYHLAIVYRQTSSSLFHKFITLAKIDLATISYASKSPSFIAKIYWLLAKSVIKFFRWDFQEKLSKNLKKLLSVSRLGHFI
jgi:glycosyltransferase involved in cell wall biosynthesis